MRWPLQLHLSKNASVKTTTSANLGGVAADADANVKNLLIDLDGQPTLSSYFPHDYRVPDGSWFTTRVLQNKSFPEPTFQRWTLFCPTTRTISSQPCCFMLHTAA